MTQERRNLLVLDLDETLIHGALEPLGRAPDFQAGRYFVYKRPHVDQFIETCSKWFEISVWTSASETYAAAIVEAIFPEPPSFIWSNDHCSIAFNAESGQRYWVKELKKLRQLGYDLQRIIAIDDSPEKHERNFGNLIQVRPWTGDLRDDELARLLRYLPKIRSAHNIRAIEKRRWRLES